MNRSWITLILVCASLLVASPVQATPLQPGFANTSIHWHFPHPEVWEQARMNQTPLLLYFHGQWCTWCRDFQEETLEDPVISRMLNQDFLPVAIDIDQRRDLFTRYGGRGLPFVVIVDTEDQLRARFTGHLSVADFQRVLISTQVQVSVTGRELNPEMEPITTPEAFLAMLDEVYDPATQRFSASALFGTLSKRPQPWTLAFLLTQPEPEWETRLPGLLARSIADLEDPIDGGFFFFYDPDQDNPARARETSKRLEHNAAWLLVFAQAYDRWGEPDYRAISERTLDFVRDHLWNAEEQRFYTSQYSDNAFHALNEAERAQNVRPALDRNSYADVSAQFIVALIHASVLLDDPTLLVWAQQALQGLERHFAGRQGYYHAFHPQTGPLLPGYLPSQVWPGLAWGLFASTTGTQLRHTLRIQTLLQAVNHHYDDQLGGYRERRHTEQPGWVETRTQAALAWWLKQFPETDGQNEPWPTSQDALPLREPILDAIQLVPGADPDDAVLGFWAMQYLPLAPHRPYAPGTRLPAMGQKN